MSYYQGDYYQGDYYQGDPFLGTLIGAGIGWLGRRLAGRGATKAIAASAGAGAVVGGGTGMVVGGAGGALVGAAGQSVWQKYITPGLTRGISPFGRGSQYQPPWQKMGPSTLQTSLQGTSTGGALCCPAGYHPNKSLTKLGHAPGTTCVRNRTMNVANPRALRRSLRRVAGFGKLAARARKTVNATARAMK